MIRLTIYLKDGTTRSGVYTVYQALAQLKVAAGLPEFLDFHFSALNP